MKAARNVTSLEIAAKSAPLNIKDFNALNTWFIGFHRAVSQIRENRSQGECAASINE
jgi:hypothetical protein